MGLDTIVLEIQNVLAPAVMISSSALLLMGFQAKFSNLANRFIPASAPSFCESHACQKCHFISVCSHTLLSFDVRIYFFKLHRIASLRGLDTKQFRPRIVAGVCQCICHDA
jgi:hypothetical protein